MSQLVHCRDCAHWRHAPFFDQAIEGKKDRGGYCERFSQQDSPLSALMGGSIATSESFSCSEYSARGSVAAPGREKEGA